LITTTDQKREDKVPLLGDVPGLGWLFKKTKVDKDRAELLIILTPHVLNTVADADSATHEQIEGLELLETIDQQDLLKKRGMDQINACHEDSPDAIVEDEPVSLDSLPDRPRGTVNDDR